MDARGPDESATTPDTTPAIEAVRLAKVAFTVVRTRPAGDARESAELQGIDLDELVRTIVVRRGDDDYVLVLVPAGRRFVWPRLRDLLGVRRLALPDADEARMATGYERGAITPFGGRAPLPVIADASIVGRTRIAIGGGARGVNLHLSAADLIASTGATVADVTEPDDVPASPGPPRS